MLKRKKEKEFVFIKTLGTITTSTHFGGKYQTQLFNTK